MYLRISTERGVVPNRDVNSVVRDSLKCYGASPTSQLIGRVIFDNECKKST